MEREDLLKKRQEIESEIKRLERSNMHSQLVNSLSILAEINNQITNAQESLNIIWKRTQQIEEEIKSIIVKYCEPSHHQKSLLEQNPFP